MTHISAFQAAKSGEEEKNPTTLPLKYTATESKPRFDGDETKAGVRARPCARWKGLESEWLKDDVKSFGGS